MILENHPKRLAIAIISATLWMSAVQGDDGEADINVFCC
jgi:hypothetical protein